MNEPSRIAGWLREASGAPPEKHDATINKVKTLWRVVSLVRQWFTRRSSPPP